MRAAPKLLCWIYIVVIVCVEASGTSLTISSSSVTIGLGSTTVPLTFECKPSSLSTGTAIKSVLAIKLSMQRSNEAEVGLVAIVSGETVALSSDVPTNFRERMDISGLIEPSTSTIPQILEPSYLKFTMNQSLVQCNDMASYKCSVTYLEVGIITVKEDDVANFTTKALPKSLRLSALKNGTRVEGGDSATNKAEFNVGDVARFTCTGDIGSDNTMKIKWQVSSISTEAMASHTNGVQDGVVSSSPINCQYSLTSYMTYNITMLDATLGSGNDMRVQCYLDKAVNTRSNMYFINPSNPTALVLTALKDGFGVDGGDSTSNKAEFNVGTIARFTCTGDIGSDNTFKIKWQVSGIVSGDMAAHTDGVQDGVVSSSPINCQYSLTSYMTYNITKLDATRGSGNDMRVQCYLDKAVNTRSNIYYIIPYDPTIRPSGGDIGGTTGDSATATVAVLAAVVGVLVIVILVLAVCLWNERRHRAGIDEASRVTYVNQLNSPGSGSNPPGSGTTPVHTGPTPATDQKGGEYSQSYYNSPDRSYQGLDDATRTGNGTVPEYEQLEGRQYESMARDRRDPQYDAVVAHQ